MSFIIDTIWPLAKVVVFFILLAYLWSVVSEKCTQCTEGFASPVAMGRALLARLNPEHYRAFRSIDSH